MTNKRSYAWKHLQAGKAPSGRGCTVQVVLEVPAREDPVEVAKVDPVAPAMVDRVVLVVPAVLVLVVREVHDVGEVQ